VDRTYQNTKICSQCFQQVIEMEKLFEGEWGTYKVPGRQNPQKKHLGDIPKCLKLLVGARGFEPPTACSQIRWIVGKIVF